MSLLKLNRGTCISASATGSTSTTASIAAVPGAIMFISDVAASSDLAGGVITVLAGATVLWQVQVPANGVFQQQFQAPLAAPVGVGVSVNVTGTAVSKANISAIYT